uniref:NADH-ubiquinone oxidoreductase chain 3 n=1 Tax=Vertigo pusilla TaxID=1282417 RepID=A0A0A6ZAD9_9EUPU|nr:NADH dehydrogenase subunit 3 [Vertigo pusilla]AGC52885.1 NADH dehydrogenase subunit 3 [Vertigo pusilla]
MLYYSIFPGVLSVALIMLFFITYWSPIFSEDSEKSSPFECGFDPMSNMRKPFSLRFFMLVILFLVFDVEVVLLFPLLMLMNAMSSTFLTLTLLIFLLALLLGLIYEWAMGALEWSVN